MRSVRHIMDKVHNIPILFEVCASGVQAWACHYAAIRCEDEDISYQGKLKPTHLPTLQPNHRSVKAASICRTSFRSDFLQGKEL